MKNHLWILFIIVIAGLMPFVIGATDTTRPIISYVSPENNALDVSRTPEINVTFSEDMNAATINSETFTLEQRTTSDDGSDIRSRSVPATVTYKNKIANFKPLAPLESNQEYGNVFTVKITTGVQDVAGNAIARDYFWSFSTSPFPFPTDETTAQQDQRPRAGDPIVALPEPVVVPEPEPTNNASAQAPVVTSWTSWQAPMWIGLILLLIALAALIYWMSTRQTTKEEQPVPKNPFGDVHQISDMEGINSQQAQRLRSIGIHNTKQLWEASSTRVAHQAKVPVRVARHWQNVAELIAVTGIGPHSAELLEKSGVNSIEKLSKLEPQELMEKMQRAQNMGEVRIEGSQPSEVTLRNWIDAAKDHTEKHHLEGEA